MGHRIWQRLQARKVKDSTQLHISWHQEIKMQNIRTTQKWTHRDREESEDCWKWGWKLEEKVKGLEAQVGSSKVVTGK